MTPAFHCLRYLGIKIIQMAQNIAGQAYLISQEIPYFSACKMNGFNFFPNTDVRYFPA
jgi:hypothetical protein